MELISPEQLQEIAEQRGALSRGARRVQRPGADIERAGQVELLVLAGGGDAALLAGEHPVASDLRVEVDVDLVGIEHGLVGARAFLQGAELGEPTFARVALPRAENDGLGHAEPSAEFAAQLHRAAEVVGMDVGEQDLLDPAIRARQFRLQPIEVRPGAERGVDQGEPPLAEEVLIRAFAGHESRIRGGDDVETRLDPHAVTLSTAN